MPSDAFLSQKFKPGQSGNPHGRPRKRPQSEANEERLRLELPEDVRCMLKLWKHATWADAIALQLARKATKGDVLAAKELRESVEGRSLMRFEIGSQGTAYEVKVCFEQPLARFRVEDEKKTLEVEPTNAKPELPADEPSES